MLTLYKEEGIRGYFLGMSPTMIGIVIYSGISFCVYFSSKELFGHDSYTSHFLFGSLAGILG